MAELAPRLCRGWAGPSWWRHLRKLPKANPTLAKAVWAEQKKPSARSVARAMTAAGYPIHFTTVARWKALGWPADANDHPLDVARANLESIAPLVSGNPLAAIPDTVEGGSPKAELERLSDVELLRQRIKELCLLEIVTRKAMLEQLPYLVTMRAGELALLIASLAECTNAISNACLQAEALENGTPLPGSRRRAP
jgi:hypothetical protein